VLVGLGLFLAWKDLNEQGQENRHKLEVLHLQVSSLEMLLQASASDRWTRTHERLWNEAFRARNPDLNIPEVPPPGGQ